MDVLLLTGSGPQRRSAPPRHARHARPVPGALSRGRRTPVAVTVCLLLTALAVGAVVGSGARLWVIESPSMGSAAPVGSLVVTTPVPLGGLVPGDLVAFVPPQDGAAVHVHRVVRGADGQWRTRGDLNTAEDPWPLERAALVGRVAVVLPAAGFALRALPLLLAALAAGAASRGLPASWRGPARLAACSVAFLVTTVLVHPWGGSAVVPGPAGHDVRVVSTGLLPQHVTATAVVDGQQAVVGQVDLLYGQVASLRVPRRWEGAVLQLRASPSVAAALRP